MAFAKKWLLAPKALAQLGAPALWWYGAYQFKLRSGWLRLQTPVGGRKQKAEFGIARVISPADRSQIKRVIGKDETTLFSEAEEILNGQVRLFGAAPRPFDFAPPSPLRHWTAYTSGLPADADIKPVWEVGRFGWTTVLARTYWLSGDERYAEGFWRLSEQFFAANPLNAVPQWSSAQEVALRLIALAFCSSLLADAAASSPARKSWLAHLLAAHAERIPPTLDYARAQNNNHLLSEAAGLYTAAALLPQHPHADDWLRLGRTIFLEGLAKQIHADGSYAQHSANYHRLILQLGTWFVAVAKASGDSLPTESLSQLRAAARWLLAVLDEESGQVPNLGPNDGAYILPLSVLSFEDYRPALQSAGLAFDQQSYFDKGLWDETPLWLGFENKNSAAQPKRETAPLRLDNAKSWAYLRAAHFDERPGHADQLHLDLWWRGLNVAQDAGSYLYTAAAPWDNALASTRVHNTVTLEGHEQMTRAGRFLWLDWAQARVVSTERDSKRVVSAVAEHDGYRQLGAVHRREVRAEAGERWVITDHILPLGGRKKSLRGRLHWLLPDWPWQFENETLRLTSPHGEISLAVQASVGDQTEFQLVRAGELVHGRGAAERILGWRSPTYGVKLPALSFNIDFAGPLPITLTSTWILPS